MNMDKNDSPNAAMTHDKAQPNEAPTSPDNATEMPFLSHFAELRSRIFKIIAVLFVAAIVCFSFSPALYEFLATPIYTALPPDSRHLIFINPVEPFFVYLKLSLLSGAVLTLPWAFYQIWRFIAPGLYRHEKRALIPIVIASTFAFIVGIAFCYFAVLPLGLQALIAAGSTEDFSAVAQISMASYYDFVIRLAVAFGIVFEMPIFSHFLARLGVIDDVLLKKQWRIAVVIIFIIAAILTPPDVITQCALGIPMCGLYALSIYVAKLAKRRSCNALSTESAPSLDDSTPQNDA